MCHIAIHFHPLGCGSSGTASARDHYAHPSSSTPPLEGNQAILVYGKHSQFPLLRWSWERERQFQHAARHVFGIFEVTRINGRTHPTPPTSIQATRKLLQSDKFLAFLSSQVKIFRRHCRGDESDFYWYVEKM